MKLRKMLGSLIRRIQSLGFYRKLTRRSSRCFVFREATQTDMIWVESYSSPNSDSPMQLPSPGVTNFVASRKRKIVGFVQLLREEESDSLFPGYWLFSLRVWPLYRGMGIGEALSRKVMEQARMESARELSLLVYEDNPAALSLYAKLGFARVIVPELEKMLEEERSASGRRRVVLRRQLD
ncbi:MAG: GNAT family N-acetyltransferase [Candidatus Aminicenantes bacterium]|nr:GNAT family N-acetyltransferase [Candidatus Aminicenantes bacterium]